MRFDVIGDTIVVAIEVQAINNSVAVGVQIVFVGVLFDGIQNAIVIVVHINHVRDAIAIGINSDRQACCGGDSAGGAGGVKQTLEIFITRGVVKRKIVVDRQRTAVGTQRNCLHPTDRNIDGNDASVFQGDRIQLNQNGIVVRQKTLSR